MQKDDLYGWMKNPDSLDASTLAELKTVVEEYPYFHTARLLYTKNLNLVDSRGYEDELGKSAVLCNDRRQLFYLIYREEYGKLQAAGKDIRLSRADRTEELLESFLSSLGEKSPGENEMGAPAVENAALNLITTDYFSYLASLGGEAANPGQDGDQKLQHHDIIDAFIERAESEVLFVPNNDTPRDETKQEAAEKEDGGEFLTETLARIYIKQKKYAQALTIIKRLSLNFPKKSVYFAHQIRFLELLISIEKNKDK